MSAENGIAIKDSDQQQVDVFKYEAKNDKPGTPWYLVNPAQLKVSLLVKTQDLRPNSALQALSLMFCNILQQQTKDKLVLGTMLCSTKLTQDPRLLSLLRWRDPRPNPIPFLVCGLIPRWLPC